nr:hypothetical protein [Fibrobacter sp.]
MKEYVAYDGQCFTVEWFYNEQGESPALEYFNELSDVQKRKVLMLFKRIGDFGRISDITKFRNEGGQDFRVQAAAGSISVFFLYGQENHRDKRFSQKVAETARRRKRTGSACYAKLQRTNFKGRVL